MLMRCRQISTIWRRLSREWRRKLGGWRGMRGMFGIGWMIMGTWPICHIRGLRLRDLANAIERKTMFKLICSGLCKTDLRI